MSSWDNLRAPKGYLDMPKIRPQNIPAVPGQTAQDRQAELERRRAEYDMKQREAFLRDGPEGRQRKLEQAKFLVKEGKDANSNAPNANNRNVSQARRDSHRPGTAGSSGRGRSYTQARNRSEIENSRKEVRRQRRPQSAAPVLGSRPVNFAGRDGWVAKPKYETRTEMIAARNEELLPHHSFDVDGDGCISQEDYRLSKKFDENKDGMLQHDERIELRKAMVASTVNRFRELQAAGQVGFNKDTEELAEAFTDHLDRTVRDPKFGKMFSKLQNLTAITNTANSMNIRDILKQPSRGKKTATIFDADNDGDGMVSKEELQKWQQKEREAQQKLARQAQASINGSVAKYMAPTISSSRRASVSSVYSVAESDLDTHRPVPRVSTGFQTRSALFKHRHETDVKYMRKRSDYHLWGGDYAFPEDPKEGRNMKAALERAAQGQRGWTTEPEYTNAESTKPVRRTPSEVWTGIALSSTWKPSSDDVTGKQPPQLRGISANERPRSVTSEVRKERVRGCGTHVSIHGPLDQVPKSFMDGAGVPEPLYHEGNASTFGLSDARSTYVIKKIAATGKLM